MLRHDTATKGFRFADVIDLVHPAPAAAWQGDLFKVALERRHHRDDISIGSLPMLTANARLRATAAARDPAVLLDPARLKAAGMTWQGVLSLAGSNVDKRLLWRAVIPSMGYLALLQNLRRFDEADVHDDVAATVSARLADPLRVARSRQLPLRFVAAHERAPSLRWGHALGRALQASLGNMPAPSGRTLILVDTSASMTRPAARSRSGRRAATELRPMTPGGRRAATELRPMTPGGRPAGTELRPETPGGRPAATELLPMTPGGRRAATELRPKTLPTPAKAAAVFAVALAAAAAGAELYGFADRHFRHDVPPGASILKEANRFLARTGEVGHATRAAETLRSTYTGHDRVVIISDRPLLDAVSHVVPATVPIFAINLGESDPPTAGVTGAHNRYEFGDLSDATFRMIPLIEAGHASAWPWEREAPPS